MQVSTCSCGLPGCSGVDGDSGASAAVPGLGSSRIQGQQAQLGAMQTAVQQLGPAF